MPCKYDSTLCRTHWLSRAILTPHFEDTLAEPCHFECTLFTSPILHFLATLHPRFCVTFWSPFFHTFSSIFCVTFWAPIFDTFSSILRITKVTRIWGVQNLIHRRNDLSLLFHTHFGDAQFRHFFITFWGPTFHHFFIDFWGPLFITFWGDTFSSLFITFRDHFLEHFLSKSDTNLGGYHLFSHPSFAHPPLK
jgi:hypothetical protein